MDSVFKKLKGLTLAFYSGWQWSLTNSYSEKEHLDFINNVEEPLNEEAVRLKRMGVSQNDIEMIFDESKSEIGLNLNSIQMRKVILTDSKGILKNEMDKIYQNH